MWRGDVVSYLKLLDTLMTQTDPIHSPLDALWASDEAPARDHAFTAVTLAGLGAAAIGPRSAQAQIVRRTLMGMGAGGAVAGAVLIVQFAGVDTWSMATIGGALTVALWAGGRLVAAS